MSTDDRDLALSEALDRAVARLQPTSDSRLPDVRRRGGLRRTARWVAVVAALTVFVGSLAFAAVEIRSNDHGPQPGTGMNERSDLGWSVRYPATWRFEKFATPQTPAAQYCGGDLAEGFLVINRDVRLAVPTPKAAHDGKTTITSCPRLPALDEFPADGVAVQVGIIIGGGRPNRPVVARVPLSVRGAYRGTTVTSKGALVTWYLLAVDRWDVRILLGPSASASDRRAGLAVLASLLPPPDVPTTPSEAPSVRVPNLVGLRYDAAVNTIAAADLCFRGMSDRPSTRWPVDYVVEQDPAPGTAVPPFSAVGLVFSKGPGPPGASPPPSLLQGSMNPGCRAG